MTAVRISQSDRQRLALLQRYVAENGTKRLPPLRELCPRCGSLMDGIRFEVSVVSCPNCGYKEREASFSAVGVFALGALVGLGIAALATQLFKERR